MDGPNVIQFACHFKDLVYFFCLCVSLHLGSSSAVEKCHYGAEGVVVKFVCCYDLTEKLLLTRAVAVVGKHLKMYLHVPSYTLRACS